MGKSNDWDRDERRVRKVTKGKDNFAKHRKNIYNMLSEVNEEEFDDIYHKFDDDEYHDKHTRR